LKNLKQFGVDIMITPAAEQQHRLALYNQGLTDRELAEKLFIGYSSVLMWRNKNKLKPNKHILTLDEAIEKYDGQLQQWLIELKELKG